MGYGNGREMAGAYTNEAAMLQQGVMATPKRLALIPEQLNGLDKRIEDAHNLISALENRLSGVLQPDAPTAGAIQAGPDSPPFMVGAALSEANARLGSVIRRLQSLLDRCEL